MKRLLRLAATVLLAVAAAASAAEPVADDRGHAFPLAAAPQRIVSLLPSLTESVCALGACARLVGIDRYSNWPAQVQALPQLGGLEDAQVERIAALRPDLVLAPPSNRVIGRLETLGLNVMVFDVQTHAQVQRALPRLALLLGVPGEGAALWSRIGAQLDAARARVPAALRGARVYFEVDGAPYAAGSGSFIGETLLRLGLANVVPAELGPFPKMNPEFVVRAQPDLIVALDGDLAQMPRRPGWAGLRALKQRQVCGFDRLRFDLLIRPGPRMGEAALLLADCLAALKSTEGLPERLPEGAR